MNLSKLSIALGMFAASAGMATAADLPNRRIAPVFSPVSAYSWTGFYVGVNAGVGFGSGDNKGNGIFLPSNSVTGSLGTSGVLTTSGNSNNDAFFAGGGQIGYNFQPVPGTGFVFGAEADIQYVDMRNRSGAFGPGSYTFVPTTGLSNGLAFAPPAATVLTGGNNGMDYLGTVRARIGYAFDNVLVYATGGLAYAGGGNNSGFGGGNSDGKVGYAVGGGVEYGFTPNWSLKLEGLYVSIDQGNNRGGQGAGVFNAATNTVVVTAGGNNNRQDIGLVRAGLNYRF